MKPSELLAIAEKYWLTDYDHNKPVAPDTPFITGEARYDAILHDMLIHHGVELILKQSSHRNWQLADYRVVDDKKFMLFLLRWV
jgi:hypothetical protein